MGKLLSIIITDNHIKIAELSNGRKGVSVLRLLKKELAGNLIQGGSIRDVKAFAEFLTATLRFANIRTKRVVFSLPSDKIMTREIIMPELEAEKLKAALKVNASEYFPIDLSDYVLAYFPISRLTQEEEEPEEDEPELKTEKGKKKSRKKKQKKNRRGSKSSRLRLMVIAAPNEMVQNCYDLARLSHLKLEAVDYIGNSALQLTTGQIGEEPCLVIQLNEEHTVLSIYHDNIMQFQRNVDFGCSSVQQSVMDQRSCGYEEARISLEEENLIHEDFDGDEVTDSLYYLVSNIKRVIEYYTGRHPDQPLEQVYLMGDGARILGIDRLFEHQLELPLENITALKQVAVKPGTGLSMKEVLGYMENIGAVLAPIDLIPKELEQNIRKRLEAKAYRIMILLSLFASLVIITIPATNFFNTAIDTIDLQNQLLLMEDVKPILENYKQAALRFEDVQQVQSLSRTNNESLRKFITIFEQLRPSNMSIEEFSCSNGEISFSALASGKQTVARLLQQLKTIANVYDVRVSALSSEYEGGLETVSFSVTCRLINEDSLLKGNAAEESREMTYEEEMLSQINEAYPSEEIFPEDPEESGVAE